MGYTSCSTIKEETALVDFMFSYQNLRNSTYISLFRLLPLSLIILHIPSQGPAAAERTEGPGSTCSTALGLRVQGVEGLGLKYGFGNRV